MIVRTIAVLLSLLGPVAEHSQAQFSSREPRYRIQPGDVMEMKLRYTPEFNQAVTVAPDGFVSTEITGDLKVGGLTLSEATGALKAAAGKRLLDPDVSVTLKEFVKPQVTVTGEVVKPGMFDLRGSLTATQAVALAGGFRENAKHSTVALVRRVDDQWAEVKVLDMKRMMNGRQLTEDVTLSPGDLLVVPQSRLGRMERLIRWTSLSVFGIAALRPLTN